MSISIATLQKFSQVIKVFGKERKFLLALWGFSFIETHQNLSFVASMVFLIFTEYYDVVQIYKRDSKFGTMVSNIKKLFEILYNAIYSETPTQIFEQSLTEHGCQFTLIFLQMKSTDTPRVHPAKENIQDLHITII